MMFNTKKLKDWIYDNFADKVKVEYMTDQHWKLKRDFDVLLNYLNVEIVHNHTVEVVKKK